MAMHGHVEYADQAVNEQRSQAFIELLAKGHNLAALSVGLPNDVRALPPKRTAREITVAVIGSCMRCNA